MAVSFANDFRLAMIISTEEHITQQDCGNRTADIGNKAARYSMTGLADVHAAEVDGQDIESGVGTAL